MYRLNMAAVIQCAKFCCKFSHEAAKSGILVSFLTSQMTKTCRIHRHLISHKTDSQATAVHKDTNKKLSYSQMIHSKREEAKRSILVCFPNGENVSKIHSEVEQVVGKIKNCHFYRAQKANQRWTNERVMLFEFEDQKATNSFQRNRFDMCRLLYFQPLTESEPNIRQRLPHYVNRDEMMNEKFDYRWLESADSLSDQINILHHYMKMRPSQERLYFFACQQVEEVARRLFPGAIVLPFGSGATGLGLVDGSDLDMVLLVDDKPNEELLNSRLCYYQHTSQTPHLTHSRKSTVQSLKLMGFLLGHCAGIRVMTYILQARVPIVKFNHHIAALECDLSCNEKSGLLMSEIQYALSQYDDRFHPLLTVIRIWSRETGVRLPGPGSWLSNFMLHMLVVHFLQTRNPPVLPPIKDLYRPDVNQDTLENMTAMSCVQESVLRDISKLPRSENKQSIGDLLTEFFEYYADFQYSNYAIDLLNGTQIETAVKCIWVENPSERGHNICKNVNKIYLKKFRKECKAAFEQLKKSGPRQDRLRWGLLNVIQPAVETDKKTRSGEDATIFRTLDVDSAKVVGPTEP